MIDLSEQIKKKLLETIQNRHGNITDMRNRLHQGDSNLMSAILGTIDEHYVQITTSILHTLTEANESERKNSAFDKLFSNRVKQITLESIYSESLVPDFYIIPDGLIELPKTILSSRLRCAILIDQLPNVANEVFPLMIDAFVEGMENRRKENSRIVCAHVDWLTDDLKLKRGMVLADNAEALFEMNFDPPLAFDSVLFLCISSPKHQYWSDLFSVQPVIQVNAYEDVAELDNKYKCFENWKANHIPTPESRLIKRSNQRGHILEKELESIFHQFFHDHPYEKTILIVQPNRGTEGRYTYAFQDTKSEWGSFLRQNPTMIDCVKAILNDDDVIVRRGIPSVGCSFQKNEEPCSFDIRFNVIDGKAESGYFMTSRKNSVITSPGQGGKIIEWKRTQELKLTANKIGEIILTIGSSEWKRIEAVAEQAASTFPDCKLAGVDIRLGISQNEEQMFQPWVLDINPRPAGLAHSNLIGSGDPGVSRRLWKLV